MRAGPVSLNWHLGSVRRRSFWTRVILASTALLGVLAARNVPPVFSAAVSGRSTISAVSLHDQRPRFDRDRPEWNVPAHRLLPIPIVSESAQLTPIVQLLAEPQPKGPHYNRPPPAR